MVSEVRLLGYACISDPDQKYPDPDGVQEIRPGGDMVILRNYKTAHAVVNRRMLSI